MDGNETETLLKGYNEWENLILYGGEIGDFGASYGNNDKIEVIPFEESKLNHLDGISKTLSISIAGPTSVQSIPGESRVIIVQLNNDGLEDDYYSLIFKSDLGWADFSNTPNSVQINSGGVAEISVKLER